MMFIVGGIPLMIFPSFRPDNLALIYTPVFGLCIGLLVAISLLRSRNLRWSATRSDLVSAAREERGADGEKIALAVQASRSAEGRGLDDSPITFSDFHRLNRPKIYLMTFVDWVIASLGWSATLFFFRELSFGLILALASLLAVSVVRITRLVHRHDLMLTTSQSVVAVVVGAVGGAIIIFFAFAATMTLPADSRMYRGITALLALVSFLLVYVDIAIASTFRRVLR